MEYIDSTNHSTQLSKMDAMKQGAMAGFPIFLGYLPIAIAYGVLAKESGLSTFETTMMSILVFAGAAQFMAAGMVAAGAMFLEIVIATFVLNFRHFVMSLSFMNTTRNYSKRWKFLLSLGLTDETFAVSSLHKDQAKHPQGTYFYLTLILVAYFGWIFGSLSGALLGDIIPEALSKSMGIALYAMFIGLLTPSIAKNARIGIIALLSMILNYFFIQVFSISSGWAIVLATVIASFVGIFVLKEEES